MSDPFGNVFPPDYLRPDAAAAHIGVSRRQLEQWVSEGKIRAPYKPSPQIVLFERIRLKADMDALCGHVSEQTQENSQSEEERAREQCLAIMAQAQAESLNISGARKAGAGKSISTTKRRGKTG